MQPEFLYDKIISVIKMEFTRRKSPRLKGFDYNTPGIYFITICTYIMRMLFWEEPMCVKPLPVSDRLNFAGQIADDAVRNLSNMFPVIIDKYVVMPNHIHMLIRIENNNIKTKTGLISRVVGCLKMRISKKLHDLNVEDIIWQRSFHDHIIRNEEEYERIWDYIQNNPCKWEHDCFFERISP